MPKSHHNTTTMSHKSGKGKTSDKSKPNTYKPREGFLRLTPGLTPAQVTNMIRDAKRHIAGAYNIPPSELETGELKSLFEISLENARKYPNGESLALNEAQLTTSQQLEIDAIAANETLNVEERDAAVEVLTQRYRTANLTFNTALPLANAAMAKAREKEIERYVALTDSRAKAVNWLLETWMSPIHKQRIIHDESFVPTSMDNHSQPHHILKLCAQLFGHRDTKPHVRRREALAELEKVKMKNPTGFTGYLADFVNARQTHMDTGGDLSDPELIEIFVTGLHPTVFNTVNDDWGTIREEAYPKSIDEFISEMQQVHDKWMKQRNMASRGEDSAIILKADVKTVTPVTASVPTTTVTNGKAPTDPSRESGKSEKPTCSICKKKHFNYCWDTEALKRYSEEAQKAKLDYERRKADKARSNVSHFTARDNDILPKLFDHTDKVLLTKASDDSEFIDFIFDNCADTGLASTTTLGKRIFPANAILEGAVPGSAATVDKKIEFFLGLGNALVIGDKNIISDWEISPYFNKEYIGDHCIRIVSKTTGATWDFIRDPGPSSDKKFHLRIPRSAYTVYSFHSPDRVPDVNLTRDEERRISAVIYAHHLLGHPEDQVLQKLLQSDPSFGATASDLKLWRDTHGPCSACIQGKMPAQAKIASSKPTDHHSVGDTTAGDIMFIGGKPSLLLTDIGSQCPFTVSIPGRSLGALKGAFSQIMSEWRKSGNSIRALKFDRESALVAAKPFFESEYKLEIHLTAAGQHQANAEVMIRKVKDKMRSLQYGILERFGYTFPYLDKLRDDAVRCIQRCPQRGQPLCPYQLFYKRPPDYIRDFRVELGEIILVHRPKRGVSRGMEPKAEWAFVIDNDGW